MLDKFNRKISYVRISVTDRCNLRCIYCMPEEGINLYKHEDILRYSEIVEFVKVAVSLGINKVRITGGEPLVRKNIEELVADIAKIKGIEDLCITTNGILLAQYAQKLKDAGLNRVNISLDTLDAAQYSKITRGGDINKAFDGISAAKKAELLPVKINAVIFDKNAPQKKQSLIDFARKNDLDIRFINKMNLKTGEFSVIEGGSGGNCEICNRLRLTSNGLVKPCLFSDTEFSIRELGAKQAIIKAVEYKPEKGIICFNRNFYNVGG